MARSGDAGTASEEPYERTTAFLWTERAFESLETGKLRAEIHERRPGVRWSHVSGEWDHNLKLTEVALAVVRDDVDSGTVAADLPVT